ncbi:hypothetical protein [Pelagibius sp.]|uniref:hypothetical protein n=1 Tax=Pelagibius sp. TaxID=1931238 RepID=UPI002601D46D|nr:hypothetical protein [Pelagibius sp.]
MTNDLEKLLKAAKKVTTSKADAEEQRRSFAYGNAKIENDHVTRDIVNKQAEKLRK